MESDFSTIFLFTDFGCQGPYLGQMEAAVYQVAPQAKVLNLQSDAPGSNPRAAAYLLAALAQQLPRQSIIVSVVDPGVGGDRRALLVESSGRLFIGPDNGLLARVAGLDNQSRVSVVHYHTAGLSASFHGRDLFAPVAARLFRGLAVDCHPVAKEEMVGAQWPDDLAEIIYLDYFGNLFTGIGGLSVDNSERILVGSTELEYARTFCEAPKGGLFWYRNSCGLVEIAANQGHAADMLGLGIGAAVAIGS